MSVCVKGLLSFLSPSLIHKNGGRVEIYQPLLQHSPDERKMGFLGTHYRYRLFAKGTHGQHRIDKTLTTTKYQASS